MIRYVIVPDDLAAPTYGQRIGRLYHRGGLVHTHTHSPGSHQVSTGQHVHDLAGYFSRSAPLNVQIDVMAQGTAEAARKIAALTDMVAAVLAGPELVIPAGLVAQLGLPPGE